MHVSCASPPCHPASYARRFLNAPERAPSAWNAQENADVDAAHRLSPPPCSLRLFSACPSPAPGSGGGDAKMALQHRAVGGESGAGALVDHAAALDDGGAVGDGKHLLGI